MSNDLVEKAIKNGHEIAEKIRAAKSVSEIEVLMPEVERYTDFVDENFGEWDEWNEEKECDLSLPLYIATEEKIRFIENHSNMPAEIGDADINDFVKLLDSREWAKSAE